MDAFEFWGKERAEQFNFQLFSMVILFSYFFVSYTFSSFLCVGVVDK